MATRERGSRMSRHFRHSCSLFDRDPTAEVLFEFTPKRDLDPRKNHPADGSGFLDLTPGQDVKVNLRVTRNLPNRDFMYGHILPPKPGIQEEEGMSGFFPSTYVLPRSVPRISPAQLQEVAFLGDGGFGQVFKHKYQGKIVAVKEIKTHRVSLDLLKEVNQEATILAKLSYLGCPDKHDTHHVNLCQLIGVLLDLPGLRYSLVLEFCAGGELYQLLHRDKVMLDSYELVLNFCTQIAEGLEYMHLALEVPIIHRDLKTKNVLLLNEVNPSDIGSLEGNTLKLIDFGLARELAKSHLTTDKGTYVYMAPEAIRYNRHSVYSDVWSLGVIFWELLVQVFPYPNIPEIMVLLGVAQGMVALPLPDTFPPEFKHILSCCLTPECDKRWKIGRVVEELKNLQKLNRRDPLSPLSFQASRDQWQREAQGVEVNQADLVEQGLGRNSTVSRMSFRAVSSTSRTGEHGSAVISQRQSRILELKASMPLGYTERSLEEEISNTQDEILNLRNNMFRFSEVARVILAVNKLKKGAKKLSDQKNASDTTLQFQEALKEASELELTNGDLTESTKSDILESVPENMSADQEPTKSADQELTESADQKSTGPESADQKSTGTESADQKSTGTESADQKSTGTESADQKSTGTESADQKSTGTESADQKSTGTESADQKSTGTESADQKSTGTESADQKSTGPESADQKSTGTESADQELAKEAAVTINSSVPREEIVYLEQQFKLRQLELELEKTKQMVVDSQKKVEELTRKKKFKFSFFGRQRKEAASLDIPEPTDRYFDEAVSAAAAKKRSGTVSLFGIIRSKFNQTKKQAPTDPSPQPPIREDLDQSEDLIFTGLCPPKENTSAQSAPASPDPQAPSDLAPSFPQILKPSSSDCDVSLP